MWVGVISLFPEMFRSVTDFGVTGQAVKKGYCQLRLGILVISLMTNVALSMINLTVAVLAC